MTVPVLEQQWRTHKNAGFTYLFNTSFLVEGKHILKVVETSTKGTKNFFEEYYQQWGSNLRTPYFFHQSFRPRNIKL